MSQGYTIEFDFYPYAQSGLVNRFNLLVASAASHPEFTPSDSFTDVELLNAQSQVEASDERSLAWQLHGDATLTLNLETGILSIEGFPIPEMLKFKITRADLNRA